MPPFSGRERDVVDMFLTLFEGNSVGYGKHKITSKGCDNWSVLGAITRAEMTKHLSGREGVGIVPIRSDNNCVFSCLDYDAHHTTSDENERVDVDIVALEHSVRLHDLPLVVTRSKSGGAHLWAFYTQPVPAVECRNLMAQFSKQLGISDVTEVFPKQSFIGPGQMGNTINLPYYGSDRTNRYAVHDGEKIKKAAEFVDICTGMAISRDDVRELLGGDHADAPPCLQHMIQQGVSAGNRNEAIYNLTIYLRKKDPQNYKDTIADLNNRMFKKPLPARELRRTITSASRKEYKYRCNESPCKDFCDKETCLNRMFGISPDDIETQAEVYSRLIKHDTDPVQWVIFINNRPVTVNTHTLMDHRRLMEAVAETTTTVIPALTPKEWLRKLSELMSSATHEEAPQDATVGGQLMGKLGEFVRKARPPLAQDTEENMVAREALHRGQPVAEINPDGKAIAHFRGKDFIEFLKRTRHGDVRGASVWMSLRNSGVATGRIRVGRSTLAVWSVPVVINEDKQVTPDFKADF